MDVHGVTAARTGRRVVRLLVVTTGDVVAEDPSLLRATS